MAMSTFRLSDDERLQIIAKLASVFPKAELNPSGSAPRPGSFLDQIRQPDFWQQAAQSPDLPGGAAVDFYLQYCFGEEHAATLENCFAVCARSFFDARHDREGARDILLFFLYQNFDLLMHLYILHQPQHQHIEASAEALQACFTAPHIANLMVGTQFSQWVLGRWLPFQLRRHYHRTPAAVSSSSASANHP